MLAYGLVFPDLTACCQPARKGRHIRGPQHETSADMCSQGIGGTNSRRGARLCRRVLLVEKIIRAVVLLMCQLPLGFCRSGTIPDIHRMAKEQNKLTKMDLVGKEKIFTLLPTTGKSSCYTCLLVTPRAACTCCKLADIMGFPGQREFMVACYCHPSPAQRDCLQQTEVAASAHTFSSFGNVQIDRLSARVWVGHLCLLC